MKRSLWAGMLAACLVQLLALMHGEVADALAQELRPIPRHHWSRALAEQVILRNPEIGGGLWDANEPWLIDDLRTVIERADSAQVDDARERDWLREIAGTLPTDDDEAPFRMHNGFSLRVEGGGRSERATFDPAFLPPRFRQDGLSPARAYLEHELATQHRDWFFGFLRLWADANVADDPTRFRQSGSRRDGDVDGSIAEAYVILRYGPLQVTGGRRAIRLGPGRASSVFISDSIPSMDQFRVELGGDIVKFTSLIAWLSDDLQNRSLAPGGETIPGSTPPESERRRVNRILYLHRVDWQVAQRIQVAVSETALVTGVGRGLELRYGNLLAPFFVSQLDQDEPEGGNVDINVVAEGVAWPADGLKIYGIAFAQEFFVDREKREEIGNQLAWRVGGEWADPLGWNGATLGMEYTRVDVFTYLHRGLNTNWTTFDAPLGSTLGPDSDQAMAWIDWYPRPLVRLTGDLRARRHGQRSLATLESVIEAGNPSFPSGTVQEELRMGMELWSRIPDWNLEGFLRGSWRAVGDIGNQEGVDGKYWEVVAGLEYRQVLR